ncbi:MAG: hypothetical protein IT209_07325 [Armatimonadetes bacterium]|nr:hypothetical protein [Armatimonadota bacterium]
MTQAASIPYPAFGVPAHRVWLQALWRACRQVWNRLHNVWADAGFEAERLQSICRTGYGRFWI